MDKEPVIYNEQGVVYLFSKYQKEVPQLEKIRIIDTHTYFPDFIFIVDDKGKHFGLEFEYHLSKFKTHYTQLKNLKDEKIKNVLIIYWIKDYEEKQIKKELKDKGYITECICLKDYFYLHVEKKENELLDHLIFCSDKKEDDKLILDLKEVYPYNLIESWYESKLNKLIRRNTEIKNVDENRYRVLGHNISNAGGVDIVYWKYIHFYTTTGKILASGRIPRYILFMSATEKRICTFI